MPQESARNMLCIRVESETREMKVSLLKKRGISLVPGLVKDDFLGGVTSGVPKSLEKESLLLWPRRGDGVVAVPLVSAFVGVHSTLKISLGGLRTLKQKSRSGNCLNKVEWVRWSTLQV